MASSFDHSSSSGSVKLSVMEDPKSPSWKEPKFVLNYFKTFPCSGKFTRGAEGFCPCPGYHGRKDRRRMFKTNRYFSMPCSHVKKGEEWKEPTACPLGDNCPNCHTRFEQQFHPEVFKKMMCNDMTSKGFCPRGNFCAFAHGRDEHPDGRKWKITMSDFLPNGAVQSPGKIPGGSSGSSSSSNVNPSSTRFQLDKNGGDDSRIKALFNAMMVMDHPDEHLLAVVDEPVDTKEPSRTSIKKNINDKGVEVTNKTESPPITFSPGNPSFAEIAAGGTRPPMYTPLESPWKIAVYHKEAKATTNLVKDKAPADGGFRPLPHRFKQESSKIPANNDAPKNAGVGFSTIKQSKDFPELPSCIFESKATDSSPKRINPFTSCISSRPLKPVASQGTPSRASCSPITAIPAVGGVEMPSTEEISSDEGSCFGGDKKKDKQRRIETANLPKKVPKTLNFLNCSNSISSNTSEKSLTSMPSKDPSNPQDSTKEMEKLRQNSTYSNNKILIFDDNMSKFIDCLKSIEASSRIPCLDRGDTPKQTITSAFSSWHGPSSDGEYRLFRPLQQTIIEDTTTTHEAAALPTHQPDPRAIIRPPPGFETAISSTPYFPPDDPEGINPAMYHEAPPWWNNVHANSIEFMTITESLDVIASIPALPFQSSIHLKLILNRFYKLVETLNDAVRSHEDPTHPQFPCLVCGRRSLDFARTIIFEPCGHQASCMLCHDRVIVCPVCEEPIQGRSKPSDWKDHHPPSRETNSTNNNNNSPDSDNHNDNDSSSV